MALVSLIYSIQGNYVCYLMYIMYANWRMAWNLEKYTEMGVKLGVLGVRVGGADLCERGYGGYMGGCN